MADEERWQIYIMPAQPISGAVWSGSFAEKPDFNVRNGVMHITSDDDSEPEVVVSLTTAMSVLFAREDYIKQYQPPPGPSVPAPPGVIEGDPGAGFN